jgi:hypothetical protein
MIAKSLCTSFASSHPEANHMKWIDGGSASGEEKQREVLDSIHYAKRIQTAHLPNDKFIEKQLTRLRKIN